MPKRPFYLALLAAVAATGLTIAVTPSAQAAPASQVTPLADPSATSSSMDTQPPTVPTNLSLSYHCGGVGGAQFTLTWTASTDNAGVVGYDVYATQGASSDSYTLVATTTTTTYAQPVAYGYFKVRARDAAGNTSDFTAPLLVVPPPCPTQPPTSPPPSGDTQPPTVPTNLTFKFYCDSTRGILATLSWTASTDNVGVGGYDVYEAQGASSSSFAFVASTTTTSYTQPIDLAQFEVRARDAAGNTSDFSTPLLVYPPPSPCATHAPSPTPGTCTATYSVLGSWQGGFQGQVTVTNTGAATTRTWSVTVTYADGQTISQFWGASTTNTASPYTFNNLAYNGTLAPNASTTFGFLGSWNGTNTTPAVSCTSA